MGVIARLLGLRSADERRAEAPITAVAAANAILEASWRRGLEVNAPRLQRLVMLCDHACMRRTDRRLVEERPIETLGMPFHPAITDAFARYASGPITRPANLREIAVPQIAIIDDERLAVIEEVLDLTGRMPTHRIPRMGDRTVW